MKNNVSKDNMEKEQIIDLLYTLQKFNKLDNRIVDIVSEVFKVDAKQLCNTNGIVYWIKNGQPEIKENNS